MTVDIDCSFMHICEGSALQCFHYVINKLMLLLCCRPIGEVFDYLVAHGRMKEREARVKFRQVHMTSLFHYPPSICLLSPCLLSPSLPVSSLRPLSPLTPSPSVTPSLPVPSFPDCFSCTLLPHETSYTQRLKG